MGSKTIPGIIFIGGLLMISGTVAFLTMSVQLSDINREIAKILPTDYTKLDTLNTLMIERDRLADRIPWAIGIAFAGGICLASGAFLRIKEIHKADQDPIK